MDLPVCFHSLNSTSCPTHLVKKYVKAKWHRQLAIQFEGADLNFRNVSVQRYSELINKIEVKPNPGFEKKKMWLLFLMNVILNY